MGMIRLAVALGIVCAVATAQAQCLPAGRETFTAGLEALSRGDLAAAEQAFSKLVKEQPKCAEARNNLAVVLVEQGHLDEAATELHRALEARPDYKRARLNLDRVEALRTAQQQPTPPAHPSLEVERAAAPAAAPTAKTQVPASLVTLEPQGATACVFEPATKQLCVYRRAATGIVRDTCYALVGVHVGAWPSWLVANQLTPQRIRLVDESGQPRLKVVPKGQPASGDMVQLSAQDFEALAAKVVLWRTGWVVQTEAATPRAAGEPATAAVRAALERWRQAWERKQIDAYVGSYGGNFTPDHESRAQWAARKRSLFERSGPISVQLTAVSIFVVDQGQTVLTTFEQTYRSAIFASDAFKVLRWQREDDHWTIRAETVLHEEPKAVARKQPAGGGTQPPTAPK